VNRISPFEAGMAGIIHCCSAEMTAWAKTHPAQLIAFLALFSDIEKNLNQHNYLVIIQRPWNLMV
jgi:hypothetical protein